VTGAGTSVARAVEALRERRHRAVAELEDVVDALDRHASPVLWAKRNGLVAILDSIDAALEAHGADHDTG
jgi:hypothetical protein